MKRPNLMHTFYYQHFLTKAWVKHHHEDTIKNLKRDYNVGPSSYLNNFIIRTSVIKTKIFAELYGY